MTGVKNRLSGTRATLKAKNGRGEDVTVVFQNTVPKKIYINVSGKEAWVDLNEFERMLNVLYPSEGRHAKHEV